MLLEFAELVRDVALLEFVALLERALGFTPTLLRLYVRLVRL